MQRYVIERDMPGAGTLSAAELCKASQTSNDALAKLSPKVQWVQSFVTADKIYCVYLAESADVIREHARISGFPADCVTPVGTVIDPTTARAA